MNTKTKFVAALSALAIAATLAMPSQAEARGRGWAIGAGLIGAGIVAGSIAAAAQPVYVEPAYSYGYRCRYVDRFDQWGNFAGTVKVCRY
jgi:hypothetical protein